MSNIWSENKYINIIINVLIYLMSMNVFHYGQFILPIICLILLYENKFKFIVLNWRAFIILCLFGVSFFIFSYKLGFYSAMGFCLPMAYYIGSNIKTKKEESIKNVIYIIMFGMITHYLLNFVYELIKFGWHTAIVKSTRYDIWIQGPFVSTGTATNAVIMLSIIYYLVGKENNRNYKIMSLILLIPTIFYTFVLRRRTQLALIFIVFIISAIFDKLINKKKLKDLKEVKKILFAIAVILAIFVFIYAIDLPGFRLYFEVNSISALSNKETAGSGRIDILLNGLQYLPKYLFGGQNISSVIGNPFHDLLLNIYDYAGIVPTILMIVYLILCIKNLINIYKNKKISNEFKLLVIEIILGYTIMFFMEPLMTGSSIFLICGILIQTIFESLI